MKNTVYNLIEVFMTQINPNDILKLLKDENLYLLIDRILKVKKTPSSLLLNHFGEIQKFIGEIAKIESIGTLLINNDDFYDNLADLIHAMDQIPKKEEALATARILKIINYTGSKALKKGQLQAFFNACKDNRNLLVSAITAGTWSLTRDAVNNSMNITACVASSLLTGVTGIFFSTTPELSNNPNVMSSYTATSHNTSRSSSNS